MPELTTEQIIRSLFEKGKTKQFIYKTTLHCFDLIKSELQVTSRWLNTKLTNGDHGVEVTYHERGDFEAELKFGTDTLVFLMHTNVFTFPADHFAMKTDYVKKNPLNQYCGMIMIYNFLSDSIKYNRLEDAGHLIARIYINKEKHYFIQGQRQYSFLFRDFPNLIFDKASARNIIQTSIRQSMDFDLMAPPPEAWNDISVMQLLQISESFSLKTVKRMGFSIPNNDHDEE